MRKNVNMLVVKLVRLLKHSSDCRIPSLSINLKFCIHRVKKYCILFE